MKCPACSNPLTETQVGTLRVDICQDGCGGIWFDAFELSRVDDEDEAAGEPLLRIQRDERLQVDFLRKRECPRCADMKLKRHLFSPKSKVEVDECPNCGGYWLDYGELEKIRAEKAESASAAKAGASLSSETIRYLYRARLAQKSSGPSQ
jgi:Zn-finger nucleic acid-binding protein